MPSQASLKALKATAEQRTEDLVKQVYEGSKKDKPLCPKCGGVVKRSGSSARGILRYSHGWRASTKHNGELLCNWNGTHPINVEIDHSAGVDKEKSKELAKRLRDSDCKRVVITAAQNATSINQAFFKTLLNYCKVNNAQLIVIPYRYKNPTSLWSKSARNDDWWAYDLEPYIMQERVELNPNLVLLADIKTQPTAASPLGGFETITQDMSGIIGHPKLELTCVPTPQSKMAKILTTTGAITVKNYIPSKAGKKGEYYHTFGACVVELDGRSFHMRQLIATRLGSFCDLNKEYDGDTVKTVRIEGLVMGDTHQEFIDEQVAKATFEGPDSIVSVLKPKVLVWHDVHDFYSRNHHHRGKLFTNYVKYHTGHDNIRTALEGTFAFVDRVTPADTVNIFVPSNHPDALTRWVEETDPRSDLENLVFWCESAKAMAEAAHWTPSGASTPDAFNYWAKKLMRTASRTRFPGRNEAVMICGVDVNHHGDNGPNGSRGTIRAFTKIGVKATIAHGHSPGIKDDIHQVGTNSRKDLKYLAGPSSWMHCDDLIYKNGKRSLLFIINGEWRLKE